MPIVPMKSFTGMPRSTWTFLNTSSAISGRSGLPWPWSTTVASQVNAASQRGPEAGSRKTETPRTALA